MSRVRVLVTGIGGGVGLGIIKALRLSSIEPWIVGADIHLASAGAHRVDSAVLLPPLEASDDPEAILTAAIEAHNIDVVMPGSEYDLRAIAPIRRSLAANTGATVVCASVDAVALADDKWATAEFLREKGFRHPRSALADTPDEAVAAAEAIGYPLILKPRRGASSKNVHRIRCADDLARWFPFIDGPVLQQEINVLPAYGLGPEYTCSVFRTIDGTLIGPFVARRRLRNGDSWIVQSVPAEAFAEPLRAIAAAVSAEGSLNIQLMTDVDGHPVPFEFNARFSGTTGIRALFGFNEPDMAIRSFHAGETVTDPDVGLGTVYRYTEDLVVAPEAAP
jgi:carbamoyl-phosphate synthase large subunit